MSCYGFERGSVQLPTKEWKTFRDNVYASYNSKINDLLDIANKVHAEVILSTKGKRNVNYRDVVTSITEKYLPDNNNRDFSCSTYRYMVINSLISEKKLVKPKKKDFTPIKANKVFNLEDDCLSITFDNKTKTVYYSTDDNNHSIDYARNSFLGKLFFREIGRITFTTKTGGFLKSQTEYDEDENGFSTGGRVSECFGKYKTSAKYRKELYGF